MAGRGGFRGVVLVAGVLAASSGLTGLAVARPAAASVPRCFGKKATIVAAGNHLHVLGTKHDDVIVALGSGDVISGGAGNDLICAGAAKSIDGGAGNDKISFSGNGTARGGTGNDTIILGKGNGTAYGDAGNDILTAGAGKQHLHGGAGNDRLTGGTKGTYVLDGDGGNDVLTAKGAHTTLDGGAGVDSLILPAKFAATSTVVRDPLDLLNGQHETIPKTSVAAPLPPTPPAPATPQPGPVLAATLAYAGEAGTSDVTFEPPPIPGLGFELGVTLPPGDALASWTLAPGVGTASRTGYDNLPPTYEYDYTGLGSHTATLVVTDTRGATASSTVVVDVAPQLTIDGEAEHATVSGFEVNIPVAGVHSPGATVTSVVAHWGDGTMTPYAGLPASVSHTYAFGGHFKTFVDVANDHGGSDVGVSEFDVDAAHPHANLFVDDPSTLEDPVVQQVPAAGTVKTAAGVGIRIDPSTSISKGPSPATLDYGDGHAVNNGSGPMPEGHSYSAAGTYTATLTTWNGSVSDVKTLKVDVVAAGASLTLQRPPATAVVGQPVTLSASLSLPAGDTLTGFDYGWGDEDPGVWSPPSGDYSPSATHVYTAPGLYTVAASATTDHEEYVYAPVADWYQILVTGPAPTIDLQVGPTADFDPDERPQETRWLGTTAGGDAAFWLELIPATGETFTHIDVDQGDGTAASAVQLTPNFTGDYSPRFEVEYDTPGNYTATLTIYDGSGPVFHEAVSIGVDPAPPGR